MIEPHFSSRRPAAPFALRRFAGAMACALAATLPAGSASAQDRPSAASSSLSPSRGLVVLDYQSLKVAGDKPIDLLGFHVHGQVAEGLYLGAGAAAPLFQGGYGGFTAFDVAALYQQRLSGPLFATAGLAVGGGAGGRSVEKAKALAGTGGFYKASLGLGWDFGPVSLGAQVSRMKFSESSIDGTQAHVFLQIPYTYLGGPFSRHGQRLSEGEARQASEASGETMLMLILDNYAQQRPRGTYQGSFNIVDLQYAHYVAANTFWFADLGVGYKGLPLSNQVLGGLGQRVPLSPRWTAYGQLGIGSGIYAPEVIDTDSGLLVYPKVSLEYALTRELGLAASAGWLVAPKGSSKNLAYGLGLTYHLRPGVVPAASDAAGWPRHQGLRIGVYQVTDTGVRYRDIPRDRLQMIGMQVDAIAGEHLYLALQGSIAYSTYLDHPGYGELLAGVGLQTVSNASQPWQGFAQVLAGTNVHGPAVKASTGVRYGFSDRLALQANVGHIEARSAGGNRFSAGNVAFGLDYRFSIPSW